MSRTFGICMEGVEAGLEQLLVQRLRDVVGTFVYLEIGVAYGVTLRAMNSIMAEHGAINSMAVGLDIPGGWSFDTNLPVRAQSEAPSLGVNIYLCPSQVFLKNHYHGPIHFALIDGCHGKACVTGDFKAVAAHAVPGTIVVFHDAAQEDQNDQIQPHCQEGIRVYTALNEIGLLGNRYPGWTQLAWIMGDKSRGGNSCAVFQCL